MLERAASSIGLGTVVLLSALGALAQSNSGTAFEPLKQWKAAVLAGDRAKLQSFYLAGPDAYAQIPAGKIMDAVTEEADFWSEWRVMGLAEVSPKILERTAPDAGRVTLVLRIEMTFTRASETKGLLVSAVQTWVNRGGTWRILVTQRSNAVPLTPIRLPQPAIPNTSLYSDPGNARKELDAALAAARKDHKRVLVVFGANWCYDCHVLDAALHSMELASLVAANYHVVHISIGDDGKSNADFAARFHVPLDKGVPSLAVLEGDGRVITSQKNGEFESAAKIGMADVSGFLKRWKPEAGQ